MSNEEIDIDDFIRRQAELFQLDRSHLAELVRDRLHARIADEIIEDVIKQRLPLKPQRGATWGRGATEG